MALDKFQLRFTSLQDKRSKGAKLSLEQLTWRHKSLFENARPSVGVDIQRNRNYFHAWPTKDFTNQSVITKVKRNVFEFPPVWPLLLVIRFCCPFLPLKVVYNYYHMYIWVFLNVKMSGGTGLFTVQDGCFYFFTIVHI